jgi:hypothetical protein
MKTKKINPAPKGLTASLVSGNIKHSRCGVKASILVMSLLIMFAIVVIALSVTLVSVRERNISIGSGKSSQAFQTAQTGVEKTMQAMKDLGSSKHASDIAAELGVGASCNGGLLIQDGYTIELKKSDGTQILCNSATDISEIASIKSVGKVQTEQRAIEAAVAQAAPPGITGGCRLTGTPLAISSSWGSGCLANTTPAATCDAAKASGFSCGSTSSNYCICIAS